MLQITFPSIVGNDEVFLDTLNILIGDNRKSFIDLGCCHASQTGKLTDIPIRKYIDIIDRVLDFPDEQKYFEQADILEVKEFFGEKYDISFALDVPEHLYKEDGWKLYEIMAKISNKQICFTPLDEWMMADQSDKNPESHRSIWKPEDLDDSWIKIVFPHYHQALGIGAWFFMRCENPQQEFARVHNELKTKSWYGLHEVIVEGNKSLAGICFVRNAIEFDYCIESAIKSLQACCDGVFIVDAGSDDGTLELLTSILDEKTKILQCDKESWDSIKGKEKLSAFTNVAIQRAAFEGYEYCLNVQADECLHEDSFPYIRQAIELGEEGYLVSRINLWGSSETMLNVPQHRKPCSTVICRLAKTQYRSVDDAESINCPASLDFINKIEIFHLGFVRDKTKHVAKIKEIQGNIFQMDVDHRVKDAETFDPWAMGFSKNDVVELEKGLPKFVQEWAKERDKMNLVL